ncbi:hypothetical protein CLOM_g5345 [Closterium sp. NIES-68]|nr:hypothetical protein CLOM_g5345 [Closterium sp. NIES-68]GJP80735.1 hypothetical protein CLOP_g10937 [Closterium sp. NIES-67]
MASRALVLSVLLLLAADFSPAANPAVAQTVSVPGALDVNTNGSIQIPGVTVSPNGTVNGNGYSTDAEDGSVTVDGTTYFPNGTIVNADGQVITPTTNVDGSVSAGGFTVYPNGTVTSSDGTAVNPDGGVTFPGGLNISTGGGGGGVIQTPGFTVNPDGTVAVNQASPSTSKPAGSLASPARMVTSLLVLLVFLLVA